MGSLDPVDLRDVAQAMHDGEPRDMKVAGMKLVEHVVVSAIIVRRDEEEVEITQEGIRQVVPADGIMWLRPTQFTADIAEPIPPPPPVDGVTPNGHEIETVVWPQAIRTAAFVHDLKNKGAPPKWWDATNDRNRTFVRMRYDLMRTVYELTTCGPSEIVAHVGYRSITPFLCAVDPHARKDGEDEVVRNMVKLIREITGTHFRRPEEAGRRHCVCQ